MSVCTRRCLCGCIDAATLVYSGDCNKRTKHDAIICFVSVNEYNENRENRKERKKRQTQ